LIANLNQIAICEKFVEAVMNPNTKILVKIEGSNKREDRLCKGGTGAGAVERGCAPNEHRKKFFVAQRV
jgi:hypothetical protein